jgi:RNA-binding protein
MLTLSVAQRLELKGRAHDLKPTVMIGSAGLTPSVLNEIAQTLKSHELIKIRVMSDDREARTAMMLEICTTLNAGAVQQIGKMLVVYQPQETPLLTLPKRKKGKPLTKKQLGNRP